MAEHCLEPPMRDVLAFIGPIFYPETQTRVTMTLAATIFSSLELNLQVSWAKALFDVIEGLAEKSQKLAVKGHSIISYLPSYLAHIYEYDDCLTSEEYLSVERQRPAGDVANLKIPHSPDSL